MNLASSHGEINPFLECLLRPWDDLPLWSPKREVFFAVRRMAYENGGNGRIGDVLMNLEFLNGREKPLVLPLIRRLGFKPHSGFPIVDPEADEVVSFFPLDPEMKVLFRNEREKRVKAERALLKASRIKPAPAVVDNRPIAIEDIEMSARTHNNLKKGGFTTLGGVADATESDLLRIGGLGIGSLYEVKMLLTAHGLRLRLEE